MKRIAVVSITALALSASALAAHADEFTFDLKKHDPATAAGQKAIAHWKNQVAEAYCGPLGLPEPIDLTDQRASCQAAVKVQTQAKLDAAYARQVAVLRYKAPARS
jgi:UrcA family protein